MNNLGLPLWRLASAWSWHGDYYSDTAVCYNSASCQFVPNVYTGYKGKGVYRTTTDLIEGVMGELHLPCSWRDDINYPDGFRQKVFKYTMERLLEKDFQVKAYCFFWNLFLLGIDDEIYDEQTSDVMSLAQKLGFTESMMRDWCRAVEFVFAGNMFSENCDLHCETPEGRQFFLHQDIEI